MLKLLDTFLEVFLKHVQTPLFHDLKLSLATSICNLGIPIYSKILAVLKKTIPIVYLSAEVMRLRDAGFDRFKIKIHDTYKREADVQAWKYHPRPDKRKPQ